MSGVFDICLWLSDFGPRVSSPGRQATGRKKRWPHRVTHWPSSTKVSKRVRAVKERGLIELESQQRTDGHTHRVGGKEHELGEERVASIISQEAHSRSKHRRRENQVVGEALKT